ncbi:MAG: 4a-hydroxytetrahydrobiopterin dehydratase [Acidithiobacillus sp.]|nr:4a-hydroxytetrahydrobiopterin dehydratase [Acidithiobacillus sp.]
MESDFRPGHCQACEGGVKPLAREALERALQDLPHWQVVDGALERRTTFRNFFETMAFVNALAWIAHREDHHPDLQVSYGSCVIRYQTHAVGAITENDLICARAIESLLA